MQKNNRKYTIAFVSEFDIQDVTQRSGVPYFIAKGFRELGHEVIQIGPFQNQRSMLARAWNSVLGLVFNRILSGRFGYINNQWSREFLENYSRQAEEQLKGKEYDLIFSPEAHTIAYLNASKPIIFWRDATFGNLLNYYEAFSNIHSISVNQGHRSEREALRRVTLAVYTSDWAANSALNKYKASPEKVVVVERGANLLQIPTQSEIEESIAVKQESTTLKILFVAADWERKGGNKVFEVVAELNNLGIACELHAVGKKPNLDNTPVWFRHHGYLRKNNPNDFAKLSRLYKECHFFAMFSSAENFGIVYAEASAFGVPSLAINTGGVAAAVHEMKNGCLFDKLASAKEIASKVVGLWDSKSDYCKLSINSRQEYETRLNWLVNCERVLDNLNI